MHGSVHLPRPSWQSTTTGIRQGAELTPASPILPGSRPIRPRHCRPLLSRGRHWRCPTNTSAAATRWPPITRTTAVVNSIFCSGRVAHPRHGFAITVRPLCKMYRCHRLKFERAGQLYLDLRLMSFHYYRRRHQFCNICSQ